MLDEAQRLAEGTEAELEKRLAEREIRLEITEAAKMVAELLPHTQRRETPDRMGAIVTAFLIQLGNLISGSFIVETVFAWNGIGRLLIDSIMARLRTGVLGNPG